MTSHLLMTALERSGQKIRWNTDTYSSSCDAFGLAISTKKTEVMFQPAPHTNYSVLTIIVKSQKVQTVYNFTYIGSTSSRNVLVADEVDARITKSSTSNGRRSKNMWERHGFNLQTKLKIYTAVVMTTLLYSCETWTVYCRHARKLGKFQIKCLRQLFRITWQDMSRHAEVLKRAALQSIHALVTKSQLRWAGHVVRMSDERLPKCIECIEHCQSGRGILAVSANVIKITLNLP